MTANKESATVFRRLHQGPELLLLANAWDAGSARLIESLGARAVATTSAGLAWANGYPDGDVMPLDRLVAAVASIARVIKVPLTVDMEGGYAPDPAGVGSAVAKVIDAGGIGCNIEDGDGTVDALCARIEQAKKAGAKAGVDFWVNARTDVFLAELAPPDKRVAEVVARAKRYRDAGADSIFVPGLADPKEIREVAGAIDRPLNVMAWPGLPPAAELQKLGVRRLSAGSGITQAVWGRAAALAKIFLSEGRSDVLGHEAMGYGAVNSLFAG
jgi:2-methylisocitrate lyase-like PEP mutase family enzyme